MRFVISNYFIALWTILSGIVFVFYGYIQPITIINGGVGWDGTQYTTMFNYFNNFNNINYIYLFLQLKEENL